MFLFIEAQSHGFTRELCQSMIHMMDKGYNGKLNFEEFKALWVDVRNWKVTALKISPIIVLISHNFISECLQIIRSYSIRILNCV